MKTLTDLLALGEGFTIEFKRSLRSDLGREICAFANAAGGAILLGVEDDGTVRGVQGHNRLSPCLRFSLDGDLDEDTWAAFRRRAKIPDHMEPETALGNLRLLAGDGQVTNAGAWLLAKDIRRVHSSAHLTCALFQGTTKTEILDRRDFPGDVYSMIDGAMTWVRSKINVRYIITGSVNREERPELPLDAIREAVVNAVAHRDYRSTANVHVYLFHDRLEVVSPGGLPAGITEAELGVKSVPRNPLLFGLLHRMDAVEQIGTGIRRIRDLCREWEVPAPAIDVSEGWVTVTFRRVAWGGEGSEATSKRPGRDQVGTKLAPSRHQVRILRKSLAAQPITELMAVVERKDRTKFRNQVLRPLLDAGWIEMTIPDKPRSRLQRYRTTAAGTDVLAGLKA